MWLGEWSLGARELIRIALAPSSMASLVAAPDRSVSISGT